MFVKHNGRIIDTEKVSEQRTILREVVFSEIEDILRRYGFEKENNYYFQSDLFCYIALDWIVL